MTTLGSSAPNSAFRPGFLKRLPRLAVKPVALLTAGAIALGGVTLAQSWMSSNSANAVTRTGNWAPSPPWNGVFAKNQLWVKINSGKGAGTNANDPRYAVTSRLRAFTNPSAITGLNGAADLPAMFDAEGTSQGSGASARDTIAVGPVFKHAQDNRVHMISISADGGATSLFKAEGDGKVDGSARGTLPNCGLDKLGEQYSAEISARSGYLYALGGRSGPQFLANYVETKYGSRPPELSGITATNIGFMPRILRVEENGTYTCLAATDTVKGLGGRTLSEQWNAMSPANTYTGNVWSSSGDLAIDAFGDFYVIVYSGGGRYGLMRINVPRDSAGAFTNEAWTYELVRVLDGSVAWAADLMGMGFMDGALYAITSGGMMYRWNTLSGASAELGSSGFNPSDFASPQVAPVVKGTVYNDVDGDGSVAGDPPLAGATIELWQGDAASGSTTWTKRGEMQTNLLGNYTALLPSVSTEFLVRLKRPTLAGVNATQSYASAGVFTEAGDTSSNTLTALCAQGGADYVPQTVSGLCRGARVDGVDALDGQQAGQTGNPLAATGGAAIVAKVTMTTDLAPVQADFGVTTAASWGDAPSSYQTANAENGPYAHPLRGGQPYLLLGSAPGLYADGSPSQAADSHPTDDGLELAPYVAGRDDAQLAWVPAQDQIMVAGKTYRFRAQATGDSAAVAASTVRAWISSVSGSGAVSGSFDSELLGGAAGGCASRPDAWGYVYCSYTPGTGLPAGGLAAVYARARVSSDSAVTATSRPSSNPTSSTPTSAGEVEDYRLGVAGAVVRLEARTLGGVAANVSLGLGNVSGSTPSSSADAIATDGSEAFAVSSIGHAVVDPAGEITISTNGIGAPGAVGLNGWQLGTRNEAGQPVDTYCFASDTQAVVGASVNAAAGVVAIPGNQAARDITCRLTYVPAMSVSASSVTATPSDNQADPLVVGSGASSVHLAVNGRVMNAFGAWVDAALEGQAVRLTLAPGTASGIATGAVLQYSADGSAWTDAGQDYTCVLGQDGGCRYPVRITATRVGGYDLKAQIGTTYVKKLGGGATDVDPVKVWFKSASRGASGTIDLVDTEDQVANATTTAQADAYTLDIWLQDAFGNDAVGVPASDFTLTCANGPSTAPGTTCPADVGLVFGQITEDQAVAGHYTVAVSSTKAGVKNIGVRVDGVAGALPKAGAPAQLYVQATFVAGPAAVGTSSFAITSTGYKDTSATNHDQSNLYHTGLITLRDANGNPIVGAAATPNPKLTWAETAPPAARVVIQERTGAGQEGTYTVKIWSQTAADYSGKRVLVKNSDSDLFYLTEAETFSFAEVPPTAADSFMTVSANPNQPANRLDPSLPSGPWGWQTIWVTLGNAVGNPIQDAEGALVAQSPTNGDPATGVHYSAPTAFGPGYLGCSEQLVQGKCVEGVYQITVHAGHPGDHQIKVAYAPGGTPLWLVPAQTTGLDHVVARFVTPAASAADSVFVLGDPVNFPGESAGGQDDWNDPADQPDGGDSVEHATSLPFHPNVRVWDGGRNNPVGEVDVTFALTPAAPGGVCAARFTGNAASVTVQSSDMGRASATVNSSTATECVITATIEVGGQAVGIPGSPKKLTWAFSEVDHNLSDYTVSRADVRADGVDTGSVTVRLYALGGDPIDNAAAGLTPRGQQGSGLSFSAFTHDAANPGTYTATFTGTKSGDQLVNVAIEGVDLGLASGGNAYAHMVAGPAVAGASWLVQPDAAAAADGLATLRVKAHLKDGFGNDASGTVRFHIPRDLSALDGAQLITGPADIDVAAANGYATLVVSSTKAATHQVTGALVVDSQTAEAIDVVKNEAEDAEVAGDGKANVTFEAGAPDPGRSRLTIPTTGPDGTQTMLADGQHPHTARVELEDSNGNPSLGAKVVFHWSFSDNQNVLRTGFSAPITPVISAQGQAVAEWTFASTVAKEWTITAELIDGASGFVAPTTGVKAGFHPGDPHPGNTVASLQVGQNTARADGAAAVPAWMTVQDLFGNPVPNDATGCGFELAYPGEEGAKFEDAALGGKTAGGVAADGSGVCLVQIRSYFAGSYPVKGIFAGAESQPPRPVATFSNVTVDASLSDFSVAPWAQNASPAKVVANDQDAYEVTVNLKTDTGALANNEEATVHWRLAAGGAEYTLVVRTGTGGTVGQAKGLIRTTVAGVYEVWVQYADAKIPVLGSSPTAYEARAVFSPGDPDSEATKATFDYSKGKVLNDEVQAHWALVTVKDAFGNLVPEADVTFTLDSAKSAYFVDSEGNRLSNPLTVASSDTGLARVLLVDSEIETTHLVVRLGSASGPQVGEADFQFATDPPNALESSFVITPDPTVEANYRTADGVDHYTGVVTLCDEHGLNVGAGYPVALEVPGDLLATPGGPYVTDQNGQVTVRFTTVKADVYRVNALIGAAKIGPADQEITFVAGPAVAANSELSVSSGKPLADGQATHSATVKVVDAHGNAVAGQVVAFTVSEGAQGVAGPEFTGTGQPQATAASCDPGLQGAPDWCVEKGLARVYIVSNEPGTFAVAAALGANPVKHSPLDVMFSAGEPDPDKSFRTVTPDTDKDPAAKVPASGTDAYSVDVTVISVNGIKVDAAAVRLTVDSPDVAVKDLAGLDANGSTRATGVAMSDHYGTYAWTATSLKAGVYYGKVEVLTEGNVWRQVGARVELRFKALAPGAEHSWLVQPDGTGVANDSQTLPVKVRAYDKNGNPADSGTVVFAIPAGTAVEGVAGPGPVTVDIVDGVALINVRATVAAIHEITATIGGEPVETVKNAAEDRTLRPDGIVLLEFRHGDPAPGNSMLTIPTTADNPPTKLVGGADKHRAEVVVKDAFDNLVANGAAQVAFSWSYTDNAGRLITASTAARPTPTDANGVAKWEFGSDVATTWTITARVEGTSADANGSPKHATFRAGTIDAGKTLATFDVDSTLQKPNGVAFAWAKMRAVDAYGNPLEGETLDFGLEYTGNGPLYNAAPGGSKTTTRTSGADGWTEARIYSNWAGDFDAYGELAGTRSEYKQVHFSDAVADPNTSSFKVEAAPTNTVHPKALANGVESYQVTVTLRDSEIHLVNAGSRVYFTPQGVPGAEAFDVQATGGAQGTGVVVVPFTTLKAGLWKVEVKIGDDPIGTELNPAVKEALVEFLPLEADAGKSKLISPASPARANGMDTQVVTAELKDANGNVTGGTVDFVIPGGVSALKADGAWTAGPGTVSIPTGDPAAGGTAGTALLVLRSTVYDPSQHPVTVYLITASVGGVGITDGSPARARFTNADLSAAQSVFTIPSTTDGQGNWVKKAVVAEHHNPTVTLKDSSGNVYTPPTAVTFSYRLENTAAWSPGPVLTTENGTAAWGDFTVTQAGVYEVRATIASGQIPDGNTVRLAEFKPGPADPATSEFTSSAGSKILPNDTSAHYAQVVVKDSHGNVREGDLVTFTLPAGGDAHFATPGCDTWSCELLSSDIGRARVLITSARATTARVRGLLGADLVGEADLVFEADQADAASSTWRITPSGTRVADGVEYFTAEVQVNDANGLAKQGARVLFDVPGAVRVLEPESSWVSDANGQVTVRFVSEVADVYKVSALIGNDRIRPGEKEIEFVAGEISFDADKTFLTEPGFSALVGGQEQVVVATVQDAKGNPVRGAWIKFEVPEFTSLAPGAFDELQVDRNGEARLRLVSNKAGTYEVTAQAKKDSGGAYQAIVGGSPAHVTFTNLPASPGHSRISTADAGPKKADGAESYTVKVELFDQYGNEVEGAGKAVAVTFTLYTEDGSAPQPGVASLVENTATNAHGVATVPFATTKAGLWKATATIAEGPVEIGSPLALPFVAGQAAAGASDFYVSGNNVLADGEARHAAWVIARDVFGNPVLPGAEVRFALLDEGSPNVPGPTLIPADGVAEVCDFEAAPQDKPEWCTEPGKAQVAITSKEPDSFRVTATIDGLTVRRAPLPVSFESGPPSAAESTYTLSPDTASSNVSVTATADGSQTYTLTATIRSAARILVPGARVRLTGLDPTKVFAVEGSFDGYTGVPQSDHYGTYTWHLYSPVADEFTGTLQVDLATNDWADIAPAPFTLRFAADGIDVGESWLVQPAGSRKADGEDAFEVKVHARDANRNDVTQGSVTFTVPPGLKAVSGGAPITGGANVTIAAPIVDGYAKVFYTTTEIGEYTVQASAPGGAILAVKNVTELALDGDQDGKVELGFVNGPVSAARSTLTIPTAEGTPGTKVANGSDAHKARVEAFDEFGNAASREEIVFEYGYGTSFNTVTRLTDDNGVAELEFTSTRAVEYRVRAFVRGSEEVGGSPKHARFVPGEVDVAKTLASFWVNQTPAQADGVAQVEARVKVQDANGNGVDGYEIGFRVGTDLADATLQAYLAPIDDLKTQLGVLSATVAGEAGIATLGVVSRWPGDYPVVALIGPDETAPKLAHFTRDAVSAKHSWFSVAPKPGNAGDPALADGADAYRVSVQVRNPSNTPVNLGGEVHLTPVAGGTPAIYPFTAGADGAPVGTASVDVSTLAAGDYWVAVKVGDESLATEPDGQIIRVQVAFQAGPAFAGTSFLTGPLAPAQADGVQTQVITATVRDANGNPLLGKPVVFAIPADVQAVVGGLLLSGPTVTLTTASAGDAAGVATLTLVSTKVGEYPVTATQNGLSIPEGGRPAVARFVNADLSLAGSLFTIPTATDAQGNTVKKEVLREYHHPTVTLYDVSGNLYTPQVPIAFSYRLQGSGVWTPGPTIDTVGGTAVWTGFTVRQAGVYEVRANAPSGQVPEPDAVRLAEFKHGPADAGASAFTTSQGEVLPDGKATHYGQVVVKDAYGNLIEDEPVTFTLPAGDPAQFVAAGPECQPKSCVLKSSATGQARAYLTATAEVTTRVRGLLDATLVGEGDVVFAAEPALAENSRWTITPDGTRVADGVEFFTATVVTKGPSDLAKPGTRVGFEVPPAVRITEPPADWVSDSNGELTVHFTSLTAGVYTVNALIGADKIRRIDQEIQFVAGDISFDPNRTFLTPPRSSAIANGSDEQVVVATVQDAQGNPVLGAWVKFAVPEGTSLAAGTSDELEVDERGEARLRLVSTVAASYEVTAQAKKGVGGNYEPITGNSPAAVNFVAGPVSAAHSRIWTDDVGPKRVGGAESYLVKVELRDEFGNTVLRSGNDVAFRFELAGQPTVERNAQTAGNGVASFAFATNAAGEWLGTAKYGGAAVGAGADSSVRLLFVHSDPDVSGASSFGVSGGTPLADGIQAHSAWAVIRDVHGNPVPDVWVDFTVGIGNPQIAGPVLDSGEAAKSLRTDKDGRAAAAITSNEPGTFQVSGAVAGVAVNGSPKDVQFGTGAPDALHSSYTLAPDTAGPGNANVSQTASGLAADAYVLTAVVRDGADLLVPGAAVRVIGLPSDVLSDKDLSGPLVATGTPADAATYGKFAWQLYSAKAGIYTGKLQVYTQGAWHDIGGPFELRFRAGAIDPDGSWLVEPGTPAPADGVATLTVAAKLHDANGNPADSGTVVFHIPAGVTANGGANSVAGPCDVEVDVAGGVASIRVAANAVGSFTVTAGLKGSPEQAIWLVKNASEDATVNTSGQVTVRFTNTAISAQASELSIPTAGDQVLVGGPTHTAQVLVKDTQGHVVPGAQVKFQYTPGSNAGPHAADYAPNSLAWTTHATASQAVSNADGVARVAFPADVTLAGAHVAQWIWVQAFVEVDGLFRPVGQAEPAPAHPQALKGAEFRAHPTVSLENTVFETFEDAVANDGLERSWARVFVADQYGNGIPGRDVAFELPASQAGALGTPEFVETGGPGGAKRVTVTTCAANLGTVPEECKRDGVYTPGLAYVAITSLYEGVFPVSAVVADAGSPIALGQRPVRFDAGAGVAAASSFTLERTDSSTPIVRANGEDSYTLTVTVMNGLAGAASRPVSGECVVPQLPNSVNVKTPGPPVGACATPGSYETDLNGRVAFQLVSTTAGTVSVGAKLGASSIPTEAGGLVYTRQAVFVGGAPAATMTELTSPSRPARADDPAGQTVTATVRDQFGNLASCWSPAWEQIPCEIEFAFPAGTWVGSGGARTEGPGVVAAQTGLPDFGAAIQPAGAGQAAVTFLGVEGYFDVTAKVFGAPVELADSVRSAPGVAAPAHIRFTDATSPGQPEVYPSDGGHVDGKVAEEDLGDAAEGELVVVITDEDGNVVATCPVAADGTFDCPLSPRQPDGTELHVVIEDPAGNDSDPAEVVVDTTPPGIPVPKPTDGTELTGRGDSEGDTIIVKNPDGIVLCVTTVGEEPGRTWSCELEPPAAEGDMLIIVEEDAAHNQVSRPWRAGVPELRMAKATLCAGDRQVLAATNFQPNEEVAIAVNGEAVTTVTANADGALTVEWLTSTATGEGEQVVTLTGPLSGDWAGGYDASACKAPPPPPTPPQLPFTGADGLVGLTGAGLGLLLAGFFLLVAARRRGREPEEIR
ncbi:MAG: Ig-like domain-containing protein [Bifidobacteriaceae bacterium]|jgi:hypothetical protein|nr:Ig-like domain-containing protein [Bifidobacteriaceae bacterium]